MRELSDEEKIAQNEEVIAEVEKAIAGRLTANKTRREHIYRHKNAQEYLESLISQPFTMIRVIITLIICGIFIVIDARILAFVWKTNFTTLDSTPENLKILKYGFLFLASQLVIFSQGFGFSSIVKLMERFSSKKNAKEVKEATKVEN